LAVQSTQMQTRHAQQHARLVDGAWVRGLHGGMLASTVPCASSVATG
jgi:hypothetical protein